MAQAPPNPVSNDRVASRARYHKTDTYRLIGNGPVGLAMIRPRLDQHVNDETSTADPTTRPNHCGELVPAAQTIPDREHVLVLELYADRRARPLERREERTARPARVRIRSRKPCVLARRRLFGWYVRLLTVDAFRVLPASDAALVILAPRE